MSSTVQLVVTGALALGAVVFTYRQVRVMLFPRSTLDGRVASPAERAEVQRADLVVRRAVRSVRWPVMGLILAATIVSDHLPRAQVSAIVLGGAIVVSMAWHMYAMRRWWRWAAQQGADLFLVEELAEDAMLVWSHDSWWGRRQRRTWMRLPLGTGAL